MGKAGRGINVDVLVSEGGGGVRGPDARTMVPKSASGFMGYRYKYGEREGGCGCNEPERDVYIFNLGENC